MRLSKEEASGAIEEGVYTAKLNAIEEKDGKWGPFLSWAFKIDDSDSDFDGVVVLGMTPTKWAEGEKTDKWLQAFGVDASVGDDFDLDDIIGKKVQIMVQNKTQGDKEYSNVISLKAMRKSKRGSTEEAPPKGNRQNSVDEKPPRSSRKNDDDDFSFD